MKRFIKRIKIWISNLFNPTKFRGYQHFEFGEEILVHNMKLLCKYYTSKEFQVIDWDFTPEHQEIKRKLDELYHWWTVERKEKLLEIEVVLETFSEHHVSCWNEVEVDGKIFYELEMHDTRYATYLLNLYNELEEKLVEEEDQKLRMLVELRRWLWF